eukprot:TRINITY_DN3237_c0_g6_i1.p1 TRINITY_DN3237_c0_g6~~TRINITY_DN3237_c0_g6_i1.p1  ORF type:complete len:213 (-),score=35.43 TRINITY_DN3237_c0_g6_i1:458-1096(-)
MDSIFKYILEESFKKDNVLNDSLQNEKDVLLNYLAKHLSIPNMLESIIVVPKTESIKDEFQKYICTVEYSKDSKVDEIIEKIKNSAHIKKYQSRQLLISIVEVLFSENNSELGPPHIFDNIVFQYHSIPLLLLKNKEIQQGYSMFMELNQARSKLLNATSSELYIYLHSKKSSSNKYFYLAVLAAVSYFTLKVAEIYYNKKESKDEKKDEKK